MNPVTLYYRKENPACDQVKAHLESLQETFPHQLVLIDVDEDPSMKLPFADRVPVVQVGPYRLEGNITRERLQIALGAAKDRVTQLEKVDQIGYNERLSKSHIFNSSDALSLWITRNYLWVFNALILLYVGLPFLAPVLMKNGATGPAQIIYRFYGILCHQLSFRSYFLFGEQPFYPRALAGVQGVITYERISGSNQVDLIQARDFVGDATVGYKVALCERDVAMYGAMLLFGVFFAATGRRLRGIPWYLWVLIGLVPIGIDGTSQLPGVISGLPVWFPVRESTPLLRTITGLLFGFATTWYIYPMFEETMRGTRQLLTRKKAIAEKLGKVDGQPV